MQMRMKAPRRIPRAGSSPSPNDMSLHEPAKSFNPDVCCLYTIQVLVIVVLSFIALFIASGRLGLVAQIVAIPTIICLLIGFVIGVYEYCIFVKSVKEDEAKDEIIIRNGEERKRKKRKKKKSEDPQMSFIILLFVVFGLLIGFGIGLFTAGMLTWWWSEAEDTMDELIDDEFVYDHYSPEY